MDNYNIATYFSAIDSIDTAESIEKWIDSNNISLTEIIEMIWKIIV